MISTLWHHHYRSILITLAVITALIWVLALTQPHKLVEGVWTVELTGCYFDYHCGFGSNIWNNSEPDAAILYDPTGLEISRGD